MFCVSFVELFGPSEDGSSLGHIIAMEIRIDTTQRLISTIVANNYISDSSPGRFCEFTVQLITYACCAITDCLWGLLL